MEKEFEKEENEFEKKVQELCEKVDKIYEQGMNELAKISKQLDELNAKLMQIKEDVLPTDLKADL